VLDAAKPVKITAIPIDFDRDNPERKDFGKLVRRGCLNLFTHSSYFGGFSELAIDALNIDYMEGIAAIARLRARPFSP